MSLDSTSAGAPANARFLAKACELAYLREPEGIEAFRTVLGMTARLLSVDNTQAYLASDDQSVVVAFRGSQSPKSLDGFKDWLLTNASNLIVVPEGRAGTDFAAAGVGARFHRGFLEALAETWDPLHGAVREALEAKDRPLWVTGHSLGGAIALLAAWRFPQQFVPVHEVMTFGAPMIGNAAAQAFEREFPSRIFRYVDVEDPVPLLPTVSLVANTYRHCLNEVLLQGPSAHSVLEALEQVARVPVEGLLTASIGDEVWGLLRQRIAAHLIPNYQNRLQG